MAKKNNYFSATKRVLELKFFFTANKCTAYGWSAI